MNKASTQDRVRVIASLIEGNSIASTVRMTGIAKTTILRLIKQLATACEAFHNEKVQGLNSRRIQADEVWAFVGAKEKNTTPTKKATMQWGDTWTWTALDADSKLIVSWVIGPRHAGTANEIMRDVAWRLNHRIQLTTNGLHAYWDAAANAFDCDVDFAQLVKIYGQPLGGGKYSPSECVGIEIKPRIGNPDFDHISTSFVERSNLSVRMATRRYTRLTNGHSKKVENHIHAIALFFFSYNFIRKHQTLKTTPAVAADVAEKEWTMVDFVKLLEKEEQLRGGRLTDYKPAASKGN